VARIDDWVILSSIDIRSKICLILKEDQLNLEKCLQDTFIYKVYTYAINSIQSDKTSYDILVIDDYQIIEIIEKKLPECLNNVKKIVLFQKNDFIFFTYLKIIKHLNNGMLIDKIYSILPFYNENPLYFLPLYKMKSIKGSLNIIIDIAGTVSPEKKEELGIKYILGINLLKCINFLHLYSLMKFISGGYLILIDFDKFRKNCK